MKKIYTLLLTLSVVFISNIIIAQDLKSWKEPMRSEMIKMIEKAPKKNRIATFDMDGTMISESPAYDIAIFTQKYSDAKIASKDDLVKALLALAKDEKYKEYVDDFFTTHKSKVYQPMVELVEFLKKNQFKVILCTASEDYFGTVAMNTAFPIFDDVIGTNFKVRLNDKEGKVENLREAGLRPMFAFGNSDGDYAMLEYAKKGGFIVLHNDKASGEYDKPEEYIKECKENNFKVIRIDGDWKTVFN
ncbi:haloacid dehalogenase-like hydrolase [Flammeovirga pectinis]|uniref:Haloacid dehalogenase-like hydrolase n=1 Tax=Flammeovirga pectinis TaxID=2494373 RepID=A0A3Q9FPZ8_9BACT|nr:HAD family hydrolase [Flammeovirga pectinis]AZQ63293.1 haloacid dehalogenase-like hydrolase [Flammeovirga pectinis]